MVDFLLPVGVYLIWGPTAAGFTCITMYTLAIAMTISRLNK